MRFARNALIGAVAFVALHLFLVAAWHSWFDGGDGLDPWFMNSGRTVVSALIAFAAAGVVSSRRSSKTEFDASAARAAAIATGGALPMLFVLFTMRGGPGNLFPIVIFLGWWIMCVGSVAGIGAAWLMRRATGAESDRSRRG